jgi:chromosome segregation ATPase
MDMRSRLLGLAVFGMFAAALVWVALSLQQAARSTEQELAGWRPPETTATVPETTSPGASLSSRGEGFSNPRVDLLRTQVDRLSARLNRLSELLEQKTAEYDALKADSDHNNELLRDLLSLEQKPAVRKPDLKTLAPEADKADSPATTIDKLNAELRETRAELAALEKEAALGELQIFELEERNRYVESAASDALVRSGAAAVPALSDLLSDRHAEIRRWAAKLLGEIGPDAHSAVDALHDALSDTDEDVRIAARKALRRIEQP